MSTADMPMQPTANQGHIPPRIPMPSRKNHDLYYAEGHIACRFGARVKQLREEQRLTQMEFAVKCGIDRTYVSNLERGRSAIGLFLLDVLANAFGISISELLRSI